MDLLSTSESGLKQVLADLPHLDLTSDIVKNGSTQVGGGGFSDVFRSNMRRGWKLRLDPYICNALCLDKDLSTAASTSRKTFKFWKNPNERGMAVAVKRLRFWDRPIPKVEKVFSLHIHAFWFHKE